MSSAKEPDAAWPLWPAVQKRALVAQAPVVLVVPAQALVTPQRVALLQVSVVRLPVWVAALLPAREAAAQRAAERWELPP